MVIPTDFAQVNFRHGGSAYPYGAEWTLGLKVDGYVGDLDGMEIDVYARWNASLKALMNTATVLTEILIKLGPNSTGASIVRAHNVAGTVSDPPAAPASSILVRKNTALGGRHGRGRLYFPGAGDGTLGAGGVLSPADVSGVNTAFATFLSGLISDDLIPSLLHADATTPVPITSFSCQSIAANQRRRQRR